MQVLSQYASASGLSSNGPLTGMTRTITDIHSSTFRLTFLFSTPEFAKGLTLAAALPYVRKRVSSQIGAQQLDLRPEGISDILLYARYPFFKRASFGSAFQIAGIGGLKLPTGATDLTDRKYGVQISPPLQPGSGSVDYLLGLTTSRGFRRFSLFFESTYRFTTEGDADYRRGNLFSYRMSTRFRLFAPLSVLGEISGELARQDALKGKPVLSAGGHTTFAGVGLDVGLRGVGNLLFLFQRPIFQRLDGVQVEMDYSLLFSGAFYLR
ncbi:MAG: transporter [Candidatus Poribacteria bacterium]